MFLLQFYVKLWRVYIIIPNIFNWYLMVGNIFYSIFVYYRYNGNLFYNVRRACERMAPNDNTRSCKLLAPKNVSFAVLCKAMASIKYYSRVIFYYKIYLRNNFIMITLI